MLHTNDCISYYCNQAGGQLPYFSGLQIQRGSGIFSNLFRYSIPILSKVGKYFGRQLLSTGSKVAEDVLAGKSITRSAKKRFKETSSKIGNDIIEKLKQKGSGSIKRRKQIKATTIKRRKIQKKTLQSKKPRKKQYQDIFSH